MKGANYIPQDIFLSRVADDDYERLIKSAADANFNMLRVWGGGIYEKDIFMTYVINTEFLYGRILCLPVQCIPEILSF